MIIKTRAGHGPQLTVTLSATGAVTSIVRNVSSIVVNSGNFVAQKGDPATAFVHAQSSAATEWIVNHNLGYRPSTELSDAAGNEIGAQILHISDNQLRVYFNQAVAGFARCL